MATSNLVVVERGFIKPAQRKKMEAAGCVVVVVDNIDKVKLMEQPHTPPKQEESESDGFRLDA